jgi:transposase
MPKNTKEGVSKVILGHLFHFQFLEWFYPQKHCITKVFEVLGIGSCRVVFKGMARGKTLTVVFKSNYQNQGMLLPPDINELISANHPVRVVNEVLEKVDISELIKQYKPGGTSSYHPRMLLKVLVYGYINNIYSSRKIEEAVSQNINFMWLAGMSTPDHNTINRFRGQRLQKTLQPIFTQVVLLLCDEGLLSIKDLYTDGTTTEKK